MSLKNQLNRIISQIKTDVKEIVETEVDYEVKEIYEEEVIRMYDEYASSMYERRYDEGGFADEKFWISDTKARGSNISYKMTNEAEAVNSRLGLDKIIEEGIYDFPKNPGARPVYERTSERLEQERVVEKALARGLKSKSYELE